VVEALASAGEPILVLSDLLMPRVDGGGLLGGIELLERVRRRFASLPFVLLADHLQEEAEGRARLLDVDFTIAKPRAAVLAEGPESPAWRGFLAVLGPILGSLMRPATPPARPPIRRAAAGKRPWRERSICAGRWAGSRIPICSPTRGARRIARRHRGSPS
jgi:CheY-like chemotaxis protein